MLGSVYEVITIFSPFPTISTHQRHGFLLKKKLFFNWFTKELQTTLKLIFVQKGRKKKKAPKHPETKGRGRGRKEDTKEQEETKTRD